MEWVDSSSIHGWQPYKEQRTLEPDRCCTAGFVIKETDDYVTLVLSHTNRKDSDDESANGSIVIPKVAITKMQTIRKAT